MRSAIVKRSIAASLSIAALALPAVAMADWTKTYVVEWNEPAFYYGAKTGVIDPGTDCPQGTNPEIDWIKVLMEAGYTKEEADWLRNPANPTRSPVHGQNQMAFRGRNRPSQSRSASAISVHTSTSDPVATCLDLVIRGEAATVAGDARCNEFGNAQTGRAAQRAALPGNTCIATTDYSR